jgi:hypothetical protein
MYSVAAKRTGARRRKMDWIRKGRSSPVRV